MTSPAMDRAPSLKAGCSPAGTRSGGHHCGPGERVGRPDGGVSGAPAALDRTGVLIML
jgi:hypothetical protein